jgi:hypothetical protein
MLAMEPKKNSRRRIVALQLNRAAEVIANAHARGGGLYCGFVTMSTSVWKRSELR